MLLYDSVKDFQTFANFPSSFFMCLGTCFERLMTKDRSFFNKTNYRGRFHVVRYGSQGYSVLDISEFGYC